MRFFATEAVRIQPLRCIHNSVCEIFAISTLLSWCGSYADIVLDLRTELLRPLWTHQRSTEEMRPNLIAMKNKFSEARFKPGPTYIFRKMAALFVFICTLFLPDSTLERPKRECGRPLGVRFTSHDSLLVADGFGGLLNVSLSDGTVRVLIRNEKSEVREFFLVLFFLFCFSFTKWCVCACVLRVCVRARVSHSPTSFLHSARQR